TGSSPVGGIGRNVYRRTHLCGLALSDPAWQITRRHGEAGAVTGAGAAMGGAGEDRSAHTIENKNVPTSSTNANAQTTARTTGDPLPPPDSSAMFLSSNQLPDRRPFIQ